MMINSKFEVEKYWKKLQVDFIKIKGISYMDFSLLYPY